MCLKLNKFLRIQYIYLPFTVCSNFIASRLSLVPQRSTADMIMRLMTVQQFFRHAEMSDLGTQVQGLQHGNIHQSLKTCLRLLDSVRVLHSLGASVQADVALLSVIFGYVVCQPVHFGFPALSQGFIKLQSEVLQCLLICFPKS